MNMDEKLPLEGEVRTKFLVKDIFRKTRFTKRTVYEHFCTAYLSQEKKSVPENGLHETTLKINKMLHRSHFSKHTLN